ncbi:UNVERIFIED_CONTAM: hypothetical protein GTU68_000371 [Idotea baltica]|nr:hypothetical protein [Idotea baltica]
MKFLNVEQKQFYKDNGYIVLDILSQAEIEELSIAYNSVFERKRKENTEATWRGDWKNEDKKHEVKSIHGMQMHSAIFTKLLTHQNLLDACEDVMDTENILLHHTKAHLKPPGTGSPFPMHQDYHYFPFKNDSMIAVFISVDESSPVNGGLCVYPGSHLLGPQKDMSSAEGIHYIDQMQFPCEKAVPLSLKRGQVTIFSYLLIHGSYENTSSVSRRMHLLQLMAAEDEPLIQAHKSPCQGLVLRGNNVKKEANILSRHKD